MSVIECIPLFYNRIITIGMRHGCILPCCLFEFVLWLLHRLHSLLVSRQVMHNSVQPTLYRYNYSKLVGIFILGRNSFWE